MSFTVCTCMHKSSSLADYADDPHLETEVTAGAFTIKLRCETVLMSVC